MKKIFTLILIFISFHSFAQNWADTGATWHYGSGGIINQGFVEIEYTHDTLIYDHEAEQLRITKSGINFINGQFFEFIMGFEYTYSDSDHVYVLHDGQFEVLYDFSAEVGDTLTHYLFHQFYISDCDTVGRSVVSATGTELINNEVLRWYETEYVDGISAFSSRIYEKIGALAFMFPTNYLCGIDEDYYSPLRCYSDDVFGEYVSPNYNGDCDFIYDEGFMPMLWVGREWHDVETCWDSPSESWNNYHDYTIISDTIINGMLYYRLERELNGNLYSDLYLRENDDGKVYVRSLEEFTTFCTYTNFELYSANVDYLLIDFSIEEGDTIELPIENRYIIANYVDSILFENEWRKWIYFSGHSPIESYWIEGDWVEGYGGVNSGFFGSWCELFECVTEAIILNVEELIIDDFVQLYPNPTKDILNIELSHNIQLKKIKIYSITGRLVKETFPNLSDIQSIDVSSLTSGMYLLEVISEDGCRGIKRFVVK